LYTRRKFFWSIIALTVVGFLIVLPNIPIEREIFGRQVETIGGPDIDLSPLNIDFQKELKIHLGLDLQGGTQLTLEADMSDVPEADRLDALAGVVDVIERRVDAFGVSEPRIQESVQTANDTYRVIVELPGIQDTEEAKALVGRTARLSFRERIIPEPQINDEGTPLPQTVQYQETGITGKELESAQYGLNQNPQTQFTAPYQVSLQFTEEGGEMFGEVTERLAASGNLLAIFLDEDLISEATVQERIEREGVITMSDQEQAQQLAIQLKAGALPAPVQIVDERQISASLGKDAFYQSVFAGFVGILMVVLFMLFYYRWSGFVAVLALGVYIIFTISVFKLIPIVLTLAGIAGFILSVAVAVDANVLIFERMREDLKSGKAVKLAVNLGFNRAWPSIRDSNAATLITCAILYWFGSGVIRGFAIALALGVLISLFTAITVTKEFLHIFLESRFMKKRKLL
jgi:preprotein translocase subunit SecD